jgi:hypothetical protein
MRPETPLISLKGTLHITVMPAETGIQDIDGWIPVCAGVTKNTV